MSLGDFLQKAGIEFVGSGLWHEKRVAPEDMPEKVEFEVKRHCCYVNSACYVCGDRTDPVGPYELFIKGTWYDACFECMEIYGRKQLEERDRLNYEYDMGEFLEDCDWEQAHPEPEEVRLGSLIHWERV